jgi:hypothetical protein
MFDIVSVIGYAELDILLYTPKYLRFHNLWLLIIKIESFIMGEIATDYEDFLKVIFLIEIELIN